MAPAQAPLALDRQAIAALNATPTWNHSIRFSAQHPAHSADRFHLYATGECTLDGRVYVALPVHVDASRPETRRLFNVL
jgi:hypothetical protein